MRRCRAAVVVWCVVFMCVTADAPAADAEPQAKLKVVQSAIDRGTLALAIEWPDGVPPQERDTLAIALLFQDPNQPPWPLDAGLLAKLNQQWEMGVLTNNCTWVERQFPKADRAAVVLLVVNGDGNKPNSPDFRTSGTFRINLQMAIMGNRAAFRGHVQAGLVEKTEPGLGHEQSTAYRLRSNIVELTPSAGRGQ